MRRRSKPIGEGGLFGLGAAIARAIGEVAAEAATHTHEELARTAQRRARTGNGAHDACAVVILAQPDADIVIKKYGVGIAEDRLSGTFLRGPLFEGSFKAEPSWSLRKSKGNWPVAALVYGHYSEGWREGVGPAIAVTVTHAHRDSYFPYRDSLYADELPLDRFAAMLQAAHQNPDKRNTYQTVVIDNREAHRAEHARLAQDESPDVVRFRNWRGPGNEPNNIVDRDHDRAAQSLLRESARIFFGEPTGGTSYDDATKAVRSEASGLELTLEEMGDWDYRYRLGTLRRGGKLVACLTVHKWDCWRPGYGPCRLINLNRAYRGYPAKDNQLPPGDPLFEEIAPLLNSHPALFSKGEHLGHAVLVDSRAEPVAYYYG